MNTNVIQFAPTKPISDTIRETIELFEKQIKAIEGDDSATSLKQRAKLMIDKAAQEAKLERQIARETAQAKKTEIDEADQDEMKEIVKDGIREWLKTNDYYYTHCDATYWLYSPGKREPWSPHSRSAMVNHDPRLKHGSTYFDMFTEVLLEDRRWFTDHTLTFADVPSDTLNMLKWDFLKPAPGEYSWFFDALVSTLCGGKQENIDHFERVLIAKHCKPSNYILPTIVISDGGGTGKSLFAEKLLTTIFGRDLVAPNVSMDEVTGQFNSHLSGKAVWFVNENQADKNDHESIKRILGSATVRQERKGKDAKLTDNTALMIVCGNFSLGAIKLSGSEVDRRFSIMKNDRPLKAYTSAKLNISEAEAEEWVWNVGQHIIADPAEVAKWLQHLFDKHGRIEHVRALHGEDYHEMLAAQRPTNQQVYKMFFDHPCWNNPEEGMIKQKTMFEYYVEYCRNHNIRAMSNQRFYAEAEDYLKRNNRAFDRKVVKWGVSTAQVFLNPACHQRSITDYHFIDGNEWKVSID